MLHLLQLAQDDRIGRREDPLELPRYWSKWLQVTACVCARARSQKPVSSEYRPQQLPNRSACNVQLTFATENGKIESFEVFVLFRRLSGLSLRDVLQSASSRSVGNRSA